MKSLACRGGRDLPSHGRRSGEAHHAHVPMGHQRRPRRHAAAGDHVDDAVRHSGSGRGLREQQRRQGSDLRRFEHDGVARGDRGQDLPRGHLQRIVPRRDRADHPDRFAADAGRVVGGVLARRLALQIAGRAGEERHVVDRPGNVELGREFDRFARLPGFGACDVVGHLRELGSPSSQDGGTLARARRRPVRVGGLRGGDRVVDVVHRCFGAGGDHLTGGRIEHLVPFGRPAVQVAAADVQPGKVLVVHSRVQASVRTLRRMFSISSNSV